MKKILLLFLILFPSTTYADMGLNIYCLNIKTVLGEKHEPLHFKLDVVSFQYFDKNKNKFQTIGVDKLEVGKDYFFARLPDYELGFQTTKFDGVDARMMMSKYDYKNDKFLDHYACTPQSAYID